MKRTLSIATIIGALLLGGCATDGATPSAHVTPESMTGSWQVVDGHAPGGDFKPTHDTPITLTIHEDGTYSGNTGCNDYTGAFSIDGENLSTTPVGVTIMECASDDAEVADEMAKTEGLYLDALEMVAEGTTEGQQMRLEGEGSHITYQKADG